jgi:predicted  nucleic acid-binding Zn-ribbon protein
MSDSQAYEEVTVNSDGVTVVKRFEEDEFPVPAIAFEFSSARDEAVTVRLCDKVPGSVAVEDLGFHPEYGSEHWTIDNDEIVFEKELDANGSYTTVYGIRATGTEDVEQFLTTPTIDEVDPPLPEGEEVIPESDSEVIKDAISGDGEIPGLEDEGAEADEEVETLDLADPNDAGAGAAAGGETEDAGGDETGGTPSANGEVPVDGSVTRAIAQELREERVAAEDVKLLRRAFELAGQDGGSTDAKLDQLQRDISDLRAYTSALEEFLDENGTGQQLIEELESELSEVSEQVASMRSQVQENASELGSVTEDIESVQRDVSAVEGTVTDVESDIQTVGEEVSELESSVSDLESELADVREEVSEGDVAARIDDLEEELSDLREWQDQIKQTFGG